MSNKVLVIGAVNVDIFARSNESYQLEDSNIASIDVGFGGVGGNIATNLSILFQEVSFLTVFSSDMLGKFVRSRYEELEIDTSESLITDKFSSSVYLGILDKDNDLFLGLNDMGIVKELDIKYLSLKHDYINSFDYIVIDTNFDEKTLSYFFNTYQDKHIFIDAVSAKKVHKLKGFLKHISSLKLNQIELDAISSKETKVEQIKDLLHRGVTEVLVTDKDKDVYYGTNEGIKTYEVTTSTNVVNATGAGDAFISGYIKGTINNESIDDRINGAIRLAKATLEAPKSTVEKGEFKW